MPAPTRRPSLLALAPLLLIALGCAGDPGDTSGASAPDDGTTAAEATSTSAASADPTGDSAGDTTAADVDEPPFDLDRDNVRLQPFAIRLNRLSLLINTPTSDPVFSVMLARRYDLGDYDFSQGINPDLTWTTSRMANWVAGLRPICASAQMKQRYPEFPLDLAALMTDAYGFPPTPVDLADYEDLLGNADLDDVTRYETVCLAVLSQLEFVAQ